MCILAFCQSVAGYKGLCLLCTIVVCVVLLSVWFLAMFFSGLFDGPMPCSIVIHSLS